MIGLVLCLLSLAIMRNESWYLIELPANRREIGCKWVFIVKKNYDGSLNKYKTRLVTKGYNKVAWFDYNETFSPVAKTMTISVVITVALINQRTLRHIDINNVFLNAELEEEVYTEGFEDPNYPTKVCKLQKSIYGLKQAPRAWFGKLHAILTQMSFTTFKTDSSLFL